MNDNHSIYSDAETTPQVGGRPVVVFGSGRSGTTWIQDTLAQANGLRTIFEPLHPSVVPGADRFANRYYRSDSKQPELKAFMGPVFSGKLQTLWTDYRLRSDRLKPSLDCIYRPSAARKLVGRYLDLVRRYRRVPPNFGKPLIIKFIRANLMMSWLEANYAMRSLFVIRHPGAVIASQLRMGEHNWDGQALDVFRQDRAFNADWLNSYDDVLNSDLDSVQCHTAIWCIQNVLPLQNCLEQGRTIVFYETLMAEGEQEWQRVISSLELADLPHISERTKPSQQASKDIKGESYGVEYMGRWLDYMTSTQINAMQGVLDRFGVKIYRADNPLPLGFDNAV